MSLQFIYIVLIIVIFYYCLSTAGSFEVIFQSSIVAYLYLLLYFRIFKNYLLLGSLILRLPPASSFMLLQTIANYFSMGKRHISVIRLLLEMFH